MTRKATHSSSPFYDMDFALSSPRPKRVRKTVDELTAEVARELSVKRAQDRRAAAIDKVVAGCLRQMNALDARGQHEAVKQLRKRLAQ